MPYVESREIPFANIPSDGFPSSSAHCVLVAEPLRGAEDGEVRLLDRDELRWGDARGGPFTVSPAGASRGSTWGPPAAHPRPPGDLAAAHLRSAWPGSSGPLQHSAHRPSLRRPAGRGRERPHVDGAEVRGEGGRGGAGVRGEALRPALVRVRSRRLRGAGREADDGVEALPRGADVAEQQRPRPDADHLPRLRVGAREHGKMIFPE
eukprot:gene4847-biopygen5351